MTPNFRFLTKIVVLFALILQLLACSMPIDLNMGASEHVSEEKLEEEIEAESEQFFNEFENGETDCSAEVYDLDIPYQDECDMGYKEGDKQIDKQYFPGSNGEEDKLIITTGFRTREFIRTGPYTFCTEYGRSDEGNPMIETYRECVHLNEFGHKLTIEHETAPGNYEKCYEMFYSYNQVGEENPLLENEPQAEEVNPIPAEIPAPVEENTESWPSMAFDGEWKSPQRCEDADEGNFDYRWSVSLIANGPNAVVGTVQFHDCPGGGRVAYYVHTEVYAESELIALEGTKTGGGGDLYEFSQDELVIMFSIKDGPYPNLAGY